MREYDTGGMAVFHGRHELGRYDPLKNLPNKGGVAVWKSGQFTCSENRTFYLLPTCLLARLKPVIYFAMLP